MTLTAQLIDGNALSRQLRADITARAAALKARAITPGLAVILVGDNPASQVYVRNKVKACADCGLHSVLENYPATLTQAELLARVAALNSDPAIHGILVQLPLPAHIDAHKVIEAISPAKDVDGFHVASAGALMTGTPGFWPCTPHGCMKMLESIGYSLRGKHAVVIGRSNIVGKPMALMLLQQDATVTVCHSATTNLQALTLQADVIVAAVGRRGLDLVDAVVRARVLVRRDGEARGADARPVAGEAARHEQQHVRGGDDEARAHAAEEREHGLQQQVDGRVQLELGVVGRQRGPGLAAHLQTRGGECV